MKQSLRSAINLFGIGDKISICFAILCLKLKQKPPAKSAAVFHNFNDYVRLIEQGVVFTPADDDLIKASLKINHKQRTVFLRRHSSDLQVFESVIGLEEYRIVTEKIKTADTIVDAGGNIGLTTVYLHAFYPDAKFVLIEPDEKNFRLLEKNMEQNGISNAQLFNNALWVSNERLVINHSFRDGKDWSLTVEKANGVATQGTDFLEGLSLQQICTEAGIDKIDIFKIDIEGAERFLFNDDLFVKTLDSSTQALVIEIHDEFDIRQKIDHVMERSGYSMEQLNDVTLYSRQ